MEVQPDGTDPTANRLSPRAKLIRGSVTIGVVALALVLILVQTGALRFLGQNSGDVTTTAGKAPLTLSPGSWQQIDLPVSSSSINSYAIDPYNPGFIVFCAIGAFTAGASDPAGVWMTTNSGRTWTSSPLPDNVATVCAVSILTGNPAAVLVRANSAVGNSGACSSTRFFLSTDLGVSWRRLPHTSLAPFDSTGDCSVWGSAQHLFVETDYQADNDPQEFQTVLERSDDFGKTWRGIALPFASSLNAVLVHSSDGSLLVADASLGYPGNPQFWISRNAGSTWSLLGDVPNSGATGLVPGLVPPTSARSNNQPLMPVLYAVPGAPISSFPQPLFLWMFASGHWTTVPLPTSGAQKNDSGLIDILGELPGGRLLALSADPGSSQSSGPNQNVAGYPQWLWIWNPLVQRWERLPTPATVPWPSGCDAMCWQAQVSVGSASNAGSHSASYYLYLTDLGVYSFGPNLLYRVLI